MKSTEFLIHYSFTFSARGEPSRGSGKRLCNCDSVRRSTHWIKRTRKTARGRRRPAKYQRGRAQDSLGFRMGIGIRIRERARVRSLNERNQFERENRLDEPARRSIAGERAGWRRSISRGRLPLDQTEAVCSCAVKWQARGESAGRRKGLDLRPQFVTRVARAAFVGARLEFEARVNLTRLF